MKGFVFASIALVSLNLLALDAFAQRCNVQAAPASVSSAQLLQDQAVANALLQAQLSQVRSNQTFFVAAQDKPLKPLQAPIQAPIQAPEAPPVAPLSIAPAPAILAIQSAPAASAAASSAASSVVVPAPALSSLAVLSTPVAVQSVEAVACRRCRLGVLARPRAVSRSRSVSISR